jgi:hypothetical protein
MQMRKIVLVAGAVTLTLATPLALSAPVRAAPVANQSSSGTVNFCKEDVPNNQPAVLGDCVGFINSYGSAGTIRFECEYLQDHQPDVFYAAYDTYNQCIVDRASKLPPPPYN